jgi:hypothetical protein
MEAAKQGLVRVNKLFDSIKRAMGTYADHGERMVGLLKQRQRVANGERMKR